MVALSVQNDHNSQFPLLLDMFLRDSSGETLFKFEGSIVINSNHVWYFQRVEYFNWKLFKSFNETRGVLNCLYHAGRLIFTKRLCHFTIECQSWWSSGLNFNLQIPNYFVLSFVFVPFRSNYNFPSLLSRFFFLSIFLFYFIFILSPRT